MSKTKPESRDRYPHFLAITTRWMDNDVYNHVNNVNYYSYFDTVVNEYMMRAGVLSLEAGPVCLVVETGCQVPPARLVAVHGDGSKVARTSNRPL